jgi:CubicO group peptidase (beta-lactamase class C family)
MLTPLRVSFVVYTVLLGYRASLLGQAQPPSGQGSRNDCKTHSGDVKRDKATECYDFEPIRQLIQRKLAENAVPSMAVAVAKDGRILWEEGFGWADRESRTPATAYTVYSLASLTKPFTATGVMELVGEHRVDLDAPIDNYIAPAVLTYEGEWRKASVREVMSHTAGLPTFYYFHYEGENDPMVSMRETIHRYGLVAHQPGKVWEYSNLGYGTLDYMTARVSRLPWADYMRSRVFLPLRLQRTTVRITPEVQKLVAPRYDDQTHRRLPPFDSDHRGASAIYSTVHDVIRFGMFQLKDHLPDQQPILGDSAIDEMMRPANAAALSGAQHKTLYGLGWQIETEHGYQTVGHEGAMVGSTTILKLFPTENLAIAVLANTFNEDAVVGIQQEIAAAVLPKYAAALHTPAPPRPASPTTAKLHGDDLVGHWVGNVRTWQSTIPIALDCKPDGDIHIKLGDQLESVLNEVQFQDGNLVGRFAGNIPTEDAKRHPHSVVLNVWFEKNRLRGEVSAATWDTELNYFELPSYVELSRAEIHK